MLIPNQHNQFFRLSGMTASDHSRQTSIELLSDPELPEFAALLQFIAERIPFPAGQGTFCNVCTVLGRDILLMLTVQPKCINLARVFLSLENIVNSR